MSTDEVIKLLDQENIYDDAWIHRLQAALSSAGHTKNQDYCIRNRRGIESSYIGLEGTYHTDGSWGRNTRSDLISFLSQTPKSLLDLSEELTQYLYDKGFGAALENIVRNDSALKDQLRAEVDCILLDEDGNKKPLTDLSPSELKKVQKNWKLLDEYQLRIDGDIGPGTKGAYNDHNLLGCTEGAATPLGSHYQPAPIQPMGPPRPPLREHFEDCTTRTGRNGDYGIPLEHIEAAQAAAKSGRTYRGYTPEPGQKVVVIDLGHNTEYYGYVTRRDGTRVRTLLNDKGAHSSFTDQSETCFADPVALDLAERYYQQGYVVAFTRNPGEKIQMHHERSLGYRARIAAGLGADIFISLHADGSRNPNQSGAAVYCQSGTRTTNDGNLRREIAQNMDIHGRGNAASEMHGNFQVLRDFRRLGKPDAACVLLEPGFLTNRRDAQALQRVSQNPGRFTSSIVEATNNHMMSVDPSFGQSLAHAGGVQNRVRF